MELAEETTQVDPETYARQAGMDDAREAGMAEMSAKFRELGGEVYVDAEKLPNARKA